MAFATGLLLIDAPASALNNAGADTGARTDNTVAVKYIRTPRAGAFPYVSAQAFRYWLRATLEDHADWKSAPIFREAKIAYTDSNPIEWWDDDLLGYMRAPSKKQAAQEARRADASRAGETPTTQNLTRVSPFRVSTFVSLAPVQPTDDFGVMARHEGDPVPHEHQFYRTTLKGLFSLDLAACGTFTYREKTGYLNLDESRIQQAKDQGLLHLEEDKAYRLPTEERVRRIAALFEGLSRIEGGAKLTLHYTDVAPPLLLLAVTRGGNHIFNHVVQADSARNLPLVHLEALAEVLRVFKDEILSPIYVGWSQGYLDSQRDGVRQQLEDAGLRYHLAHPREVLQQFVGDLRAEHGAAWLR